MGDGSGEAFDVVNQLVESEKRQSGLRRSVLRMRVVREAVERSAGDETEDGKGRLQSRKV